MNACRSVLLFLAMIGLGAARAAPTAPRPNILLCLADDWSYPHASILGDKVVRTPAFDRVAREGVLFHRAYTAAPSCSPSRAAILTGQWPWRLEHGSALLGFLPQKFSAYPDLLAAAGYHVGHAVKGYAPGGVADRPHNPAGPAYPDFAAFLAARPVGAPFCFWLGSRYPHRPYPWRSGRADLDAIAVPPYLPDTPATRQDIADYYGAVETFDAQVAAAIAALEAAGELDRTLVVVTADNGWPFPRAKATCYAAGTREPLAIRWGARVGGGRTVDDPVSLVDLCPTFLEAAGLALPAGLSGRSLLSLLLASGSGVLDPARDHVLTGMETHVPARDLGDGRLGGYPMRALVTRRYHYIRNFAPERWPAGDPPGDLAILTYANLATKTQTGFADTDASPTKAEIVLQREHASLRAYFAAGFGHRPAREVYDHAADPFQLRNLASEPAFADLVRTLDAQLMQALAAGGDPRALGRGAEFDTYTVGKPAWPGSPPTK